MSRNTGRLMDGLVIAAALAGLALNAWLLTLSLRGGAVAGCGGGPCDAVTTSRWAYLLGLPVSAFGTAAYLAILASFIPGLRRIRMPLLSALTGAAAWFVFVQAVFLKTFCPVCNAVHAIGLAACAAGLATAGPKRFRRASFWAYSAFLTVGLLQVHGPVKKTHLVDDAPPATPARQVSFDGGRLSFDPAMHPRLGDPAAERILVEFFDYQCAACRTMAGHLDALMAAHPGRVAVLVMPVPLEAACNAHLGATPAHPGSCETARLALAVWRARPDAFPAFHKSLIESPSAQNARSLALAIIPRDTLDAALADPWIDSTLRANTAAWHSLSRSTSKLPKLLIRDRRVLHGLPSDTADFLRVMKGELAF